MINTNMVSVIVPVHNSTKYLQKCIESILSQSYRNIELILVNDGSTDDSGGICDSYTLKDKRVKVIHKDNSGPSDARNCGIKMSKGEFIFFIDSDDFIEIDTIRLLVESCVTNNSDLSIVDFRKIGKKNEASGNDRIFTTNTLLEKEDIVDYVRKYLLSPNKFPLLTQSWGRIFRSSIIKDNKIFFDSKLLTFEDLLFNFSYLKHVDKISFLDKPLYNLLIHTDHLSASMAITGCPDSLFGYPAALTGVEEFLNATYDRSEVCKEIGQAYVRYTIIQLIRLCLQINDENKEAIYKFIQKLIREPRLRDGLKFYSSLKGESKIIPILLKLKLTKMVIMACQLRARERYGRRL